MWCYYVTTPCPHTVHHTPVAQSSLFFAKYILVRTLTTAPLQLLRVVTLAKQYLHSRILKSSPHKLQSLYGPSTRDLGKSVPIVVVNYILALVYAPISPAIVLPACSLYFGVSFVLAKYKLLCVCAERCLGLRVVSSPGVLWRAAMCTSRSSKQVVGSGRWQPTAWWLVSCSRNYSWRLS